MRAKLDMIPPTFDNARPEFIGIELRPTRGSGRQGLERIFALRGENDLAVPTVERPSPPAALRRKSMGALGAWFGIRHNLDQSVQLASAASRFEAMLLPTDDSDHPLAKQFADFILDTGFPCVGAKSALAKSQIRFVVGRDMRSAWDDLRIYPNLLDLAWSYAREPTLFHSLAVLFEQDSDLDETEFEACLWDRLASLTDKDDWHGQHADPRVSANPGDPHFSLSFGGEAFFVSACIRAPAARRGASYVQP